MKTTLLVNTVTLKGYNGKLCMVSSAINGAKKGNKRFYVALNSRIAKKYSIITNKVEIKRYTAEKEQNTPKVQKIRVNDGNGRDITEYMRTKYYQYTDIELFNMLLFAYNAYTVQSEDKTVYWLYINALMHIEKDIPKMIIWLE